MTDRTQWAWTLVGLVAALSQPVPRVHAVSLHVLVTLSDGVTPVAQFGRDDIRLRIDGQEMTDFAWSSVSNQVTATVLFDMTQSAGNLSADRTHPSSMVAAFNAAAGRLGPTDRVRLGRIARTPFLLPAFASPTEVPSLSAQVCDLAVVETVGTSPIWDTVDAAIDGMQTAFGRRIIVLATDGLATGDHRFRDEVIDRAALEDIAIAGIVRPVIVDAGLSDAAARTGGMLVGAHTTLESRTAAWTRVFSAMKTGYVLTFNDSGDGPHDVDVSTSLPHVHVFARHRYRDP